MDLYRNDHPLWATLTLCLTFNPLFIHIAICIYNFYNAKRSTGNFDWKDEVKKLAIHFPLVLPIKNAWGGWKLFRMRYGTEKFDSKNSRKAEEILNEAGMVNIYESFTESGPQSITQLVIVLSTGDISTTQMVSMSISIFSLAWASSRAYFIQRGRDESDPEPEFKMVLMRVFPSMFMMVINSIFLWTMIAGLLGRYVFFGLVFCFCTNYWSLKIVDSTLRTQHKPILIAAQVYVVTQVYGFLGVMTYIVGVDINDSDNDITDYSNFVVGILLGGLTIFNSLMVMSWWMAKRTAKTNGHEAGKNEKANTKKKNKEEEKEHFCFKAALTAILLPCVPGSKSYVFLTSAVLSLINKVFLLAFAVLLVHRNMI
jgi:hypothetical protein